MGRSCFVYIILLLSCAGCIESRITRELRSFQSEKIVFPSDMFAVIDRNVIEAPQPETDNIFVIFYDSTECSTCQISRIYDYLSFYEESEESGDFSIMMIFSPRYEYYSEVMEQLVILNFPFPIYIDYNGSFAKENSVIPEDRYFHSFLLDKEGHPVFVGDPLASDRMMELL